MSVRNVADLLQRQEKFDLMFDLIEMKSKNKDYVDMILPIHYFIKIGFDKKSNVYGSTKTLKKLCANPEVFSYVLQSQYVGGLYDLVGIPVFKDIEKDLIDSINKIEKTPKVAILTMMLYFKKDFPREEIKDFPIVSFQNRFSGDNRFVYDFVSGLLDETKNESDLKKIHDMLEEFSEKFQCKEIIRETLSEYMGVLMREVFADLDKAQPQLSSSFAWGVLDWQIKNLKFIRKLDLDLDRKEVASAGERLFKMDKLDTSIGGFVKELILKNVKTVGQEKFIKDYANEPFEWDRQRTAEVESFLLTIMQKSKINKPKAKLL